MTAPTTTPEIIRYRDAVRAALADLSAEDRDDLMEDVESHLTEVAAENDGSLARLVGGGEPAAKKGKAPRTHWDMLLERRSIEDLEEVLAERLEVLRGRRTRSA